MTTQLIGRKFAHYEIESQIGMGGMGTVFRGRDLSLDRPVAIKVMHAQYAQQPTFRDRFLLEARAAANLDHPSIINIYEFGEADDLLYMATEYIPTGSLGSYINSLHEKGQSLPLSESLMLIAQVAEALAYAHRRDLIHRDIKPDNILIKELDKPDRPNDLSLRAIVLDFGLAKLLSGDSMTRTGTFMGTLAYMSPEQALAGEIDGRSDLYSLGVILYQLVTGRLPHEINSPTEAVLKHMREEPIAAHELRKGVPIPVSNVIAKALAKKPDDRYQSGDALAADLREVGASLTWAQMSAYAPPDSTVSLVTTVRDSKPPQPLVSGTVVEPPQSALPPQTVMEPKPALPMQTVVEPEPKLPVQPVIEPKPTPPMQTVVEPKPTPPMQTVVEPKPTPPAQQTPDEPKSPATESAWVAATPDAVSDVLPLQSYMPGVDEKKQPAAAPPVPATRVAPPTPPADAGHTVIEESGGMSQWTQATPQQAQVKLTPVSRESADDPVATIAGGPAVDRKKLENSVTVTLTPNHTRVDPGQLTQVQANLFNQGNTVSHYELTVEGENVAQWAELTQPTIRLMPGQQGVVPVAFRVPKSSAAQAGWHNYHLIVRSAETGVTCGQTDGRLNVMPFEQFSTSLQPTRIKHGRSVNVILNNEGNSAASYTLAPRDPAGAIRFDEPGGAIEIAAGDTQAIPMRLRSNERRFMGRTERYPFEVRISSTSGDRQTQRGELTAPPVISTLGCLLLVLLVPLLLFVGTGFLHEKLPFVPESVVNAICPIFGTCVTDEVLPPPVTPEVKPTAIVEDQTPELFTETRTIGTSGSGRDIAVVRYGDGEKVIVLIGGIHAGRAPASVATAAQAIAYYPANPSDLPASVSLYIIENMNPDGQGSFNGNGVNLNRNFDCRWSGAQPSYGAAPRSEPEAAAIGEFLLAVKPTAVIILDNDSSIPRMAIAGLCEGPSAVSADLARTFALAAGYTANESGTASGTSFTGDLSDWLDSQGIPAIYISLPTAQQADWTAVKNGLQAVME